MGTYARDRESGQVGGWLGGRVTGHSVGRVGERACSQAGIFFFFQQGSLSFFIRRKQAVSISWERERVCGRAGQRGRGEMGGRAVRWAAARARE